jgi:uncharacterized protein (TIGR02996 family)
MSAAALLGEILTDPAAVAPRRVYADQLLAAGDPRGELIQLQCDAAELDPDDPARAPLDERAGDLLAEHEVAWTAPLRTPGVLDDRLDRLAFRRGFVEVARLDAAQVAAELPRLRAATPLRELAIRVDRPAMARLGEVPGICELETLRFELGAGIDDVGGFAHWPHQGRLRALDLPGGPAALAAIVAAPALASLERLRVPDAGADALAVLAAHRLPALVALELHRPHLFATQVPVLASLRELILDGAFPIDVVLAGQLARLPRLTRLGLPGCFIGAAELRLLCEASSLRHLDLSRNRIRADACVAFAEEDTHLPRLVSLDLRDNAIGSKGLATIAASDRLPALRSLAITASGKTGFAALGAGPVGARLRRLVAGRVGEAELSRMVAGLRELRELHLDSGAWDLRPLLSSPLAERLRVLGLSGVYSMQQVCAAELPELRALWLDDLDDDAAIALAANPSLTRLRALTARGTKVTDRGATALATSPHLRRLHAVRLRLPGTAEAGRAALRERFGYGLA